MSIELDPKEVLEHLHCLGYQNISKEQLKEFMRDLKKLICYDQQKKRRAQSSAFPSQVSPPKERQKTVLGDSDDPQIFNHDCSKRQDNEERLGPPLPSCSTKKKNCENNGIEDYSLPIEEEDKDEDDDDDDDVCCHSKEDSRRPVRKENIPPRPCSSFIRTGIRAGAKNSKSDPVALFHRYQNMWSQQRRPGENPHSDLRWRIRHQMMGQRPCVCPCCLMSKGFENMIKEQEYFNTKQEKELLEQRKRGTNSCEERERIEEIDKKKKEQPCVSPKQKQIFQKSFELQNKIMKKPVVRSTSVERLANRPEFQL